MFSKLTLSTVFSALLLSTFTVASVSATACKGENDSHSAIRTSFAAITRGPGNAKVLGFSVPFQLPVLERAIPVLFG
ncbi:hypothetical protein BDP27DRAFT_436531 [Rhodocollybia butyracea]|uniref:Uncharacterized protein n=1 Tax=Rhodocollybia butyracea TaxID=206335 RepID=A0A9P5TY16_9AGAR|nr:hypothetical protein BDP27DRAFT_436531 [Rhodocollybia butyracea]